MPKVLFSHPSPHSAPKSYQLIESYIQKLDEEYRSKASYQLDTFPEEKRLVLKGTGFTAKLQVKPEETGEIEEAKETEEAEETEIGGETKMESTSQVEVHLEIPLAALIFKGKIQKELSSHIKKALYE